MVNDAGDPVEAGETGELCIAGPNVMLGYWKEPERTEAAFLDPHQKWYRTGDMVFENGDGDFVLTGRLDRMIKRKGYRVEPAEIEVALRQCGDVRQAAVTVLQTSDGALLIAHFTTDQTSALNERELRNFCAQRLPEFLIPDVFVRHLTLPTTLTDKIDYATLTEIASWISR